MIFTTSEEVHIPSVPAKDAEELRSRLLKVSMGAEPAFFNHTRASHNATAAVEAWDITLQFFRNGSLD